MAKGQQRQPKEKKKPKAEAKAKPVSGYKATYGGASSTPSLAPPDQPGGATTASGWLLRLSASATKPEAFIASTKPRR
jgi:hypothetical protein